MIDWLFRAGIAVTLAVCSYTTGYNQGWFEGIKFFAKRVAEDTDSFEQIIERQRSERREE